MSDLNLEGTRLCPGKKDPLNFWLFSTIFRFQGGILKYVINWEYVKMQKMPIKTYLKKKIIWK